MVGLIINSVVALPLSYEIRLHHLHLESYNSHFDLNNENGLDRSEKVFACSFLKHPLTDSKIYEERQNLRQLLLTHDSFVRCLLVQQYGTYNS